VNRAALDILYGEAASGMDFGVAEFDVAVFLAALGEDFETYVNAEHVEFVVGGLFPEEIDGGSSGDLGLRGHGELFGSGSYPLLGECGSGGERDQGRKDEQSAARDHVHWIFLSSLRRR
jgi:hypothetical protein